MAREAKLSKVYKWALVIDEQELRRLVDECQRSVVGETNSEPDSVKLELEVQFSHGLSFSTEQVNDVVAEENPRGRSITGLHIRVSSISLEILCNIASNPKDRTTNLSVRGPDRQWVYVTFSRIEDRLRRMKQWYAPTRTMLVPLVFGTLLTYLLLLAGVENSYPGLIEKVAQDGRSQLTRVGTAALLGVFPLILVVVIGAALLLPDPVFRIGDGVARHDLVKSIRSNAAKIVVGVLVTAILTRIGSALTSLW